MQKQSISTVDQRRCRSRSASAVLIAVTLLMASGLVAPGGQAQEIDQKHQKIYGLLATQWPVNTIPVCWENPSTTNARERRWTRVAVEQTWQLHSTLNFTGWGACQNNSQGIRIGIFDVRPYTLGLGNQLDAVMNGMVLNFTFQNWGLTCSQSLEFCIKAIAVHEFGHALGFAHEQNRPDAPIECQAEKAGGDGDTYLTYYDLTSIMNYCNPDWNGNGKLSRQDIVGLQTWYGVAQWSKLTSYSGLCLDVDRGARDQNGAKVQVWSCSGQAQQRWKFENGRIRNDAGLCLDVDRYTQYQNGAKVQVWECAGTENQRWTYSTGRLMSNAGLCLDVDRPTQYNNGAKVQVWQCSGSENQQWKNAILPNPYPKFNDPNAGNWYEIVSTSGLCLDVHRPDQHLNGAKLQVWSCSGGENQRWQLQNGQIISHTGMCLDVDRPLQYSNGAKVQVWQCSGSGNQLWTVLANYIFSNAGKCLDVDVYTQNNNGAKVQTWQCSGRANQMWTLRRLDR